jgi:hypothetical protein
MTEKARFIDNGDGSIADAQTGLTWASQDSWQREAKWVTWDEAAEHARYMNAVKLAGHEDWRLPSPDEAATLYLPDKINRDKYGNEIHLDPVFPEGSLAAIWLAEPAAGDEAYFLDLRTGAIELKFKSVAGRMAARPVRGGPTKR